MFRLHRYPIRQLYSTRALRHLQPLSALIGTLLLSLNIAGLFLSLHNPEIRHEDGVLFKDDITLDHRDVTRRISRSVGEDVQAYLSRLNQLINNGIAHYWRDEGAEKYNLRIPVWENYLLFAARFLKPDTFGRYEYLDYHKAIERGVGFCSQQAIIVTGILNDNGVEAQIVGLSGHVVLRAEVRADTWHVLDPDYGVSIPHDIDEIRKNPDLVRQYYADIEDSYLSLNDPQRISLRAMIDLYGSEDISLVPNGVAGYAPRRYQFERLSYLAIWIIPFILMVPYSLSLATRIHAGA